MRNVHLRPAVAPLVASAASLAVVLGAATARADVVTLPASLDATIYAEAPSGANAAGEHLTTGMNSQGAERRALVAFDVSIIPAGSTIQGASLTLYASRGSGDGLDLALHEVLAPWGEGTSNAGGEEGQSAAATPGDPTWTYRVFDTATWTAEGGDFAAAASATTFVDAIDTTYTWDDPSLATDVQGWLDDPTTSHGWIVIPSDVAPGNTRRFDSRTFGDDAREPSLVVAFDPPSASGAGGSGGAGGGPGVGGGAGSGGAGGSGAGGGAASGAGGNAPTGSGGSDPTAAAGAGAGGAPSGGTTTSASGGVTSNDTSSSAGGGSGDGVDAAGGDGCDCASTPGAPSGSGVGLGALVAALLASRRRRPSR
jgi:MYXO-CTERM domain-containing protein